MQNGNRSRPRTRSSQAFGRDGIIGDRDRRRRRTAPSGRRYQCTTVMALGALAGLPLQAVLAQQPPAGPMSEREIGRIVEAQSPAQNSAQPTREYSIAAGLLSDVLPRFAAEAGVQISIDGALIEGLNSPGVHGEHSVESGFRAALTGHRLSVIRQGDDRYLLREQAAAASPQAPVSGADRGLATLAAVTVSSRVPASQEASEGTGLYTTRNTRSATRLNLSRRETPQSISVMTRQQIEDQGIQSIEDVALQTTGMTLTRGATERTTLRARGLAVSAVVVDGVPEMLNTDMTGLNTLAMYDRVEVLRGAAGLLQGTGNPSATVSLARKRPTAQHQVELSGGLGRWNNTRAELDAGGPLNDAGTLRGRTVIAWQDTDSFRSHYHNDRRILYGTLEVSLAPNTTLSVGASYNREINNGSTWYGLPTYRDGRFLPISRSANYTPPWTYWNKDNRSVFADLEHRWDNGWDLRLSTRASNADMDALYANIGRDDTSDDIRSGFAGTSDYAQRLRGVDLNLSGPFDLLGRRHELLLGATWRNEFQHSTGRRATGYGFTVDQTRPDLFGQAPAPILGDPWGDQRNRVRQHGFYLTSRLNLADPLKLILGGRLDWYTSTDETTVEGTRYAVDGKFTPYAGLVYDLNPTYSTYTSFTRIFQPQGGWVSRTGSVLPPVTGTNVEVGLKGEYLEGALNASVAAFKVSQTNLAASLASDQCAPGVPWCSEAVGEVEGRGIELEVAGQLTARWQLSAGYTYTRSKHIEATSDAAAGDRFATDQPRHLFKLFTTWQLPGGLSDWRIGGGLRVQNAIHQDTGTVRIRQGGYALADLMLAWQATSHLDLRLNIANLFDRYYYESIARPSDGNGFGVPRSWMLTARYRF